MVRLTRPLWARVILAAVALALACLVFTTAAWNFKSPSSDRWVPAVLPDDPSITFDRAMDAMRSTRGTAVPGLLPEVDRAAKLDPLDARPLFLHAFEQVLRSSQRAPIALLESSRRRNPRLNEARLLLLDRYGRSGRAPEAVREAQSLTVLMPQQQPLMVRLIAGLAGLPNGPTALSRALPTSPIAGPVMLRLSQTGTDRAVLEQLAQPMRGIGGRGGDTNWIGELVSTLARRPDMAGARSLWAVLYDVEPASVGSQVADPGFAGSGNPPFAWKLTANEAGAAQIHDEALDVFYYGRSSATFASQMLMLPPGSYRLASRASSPDAQAPRGLYWQITCVGGAELPLRVELSSLMGEARSGEGSFTIPATDCEAQDLQLVAIAFDPPRQQSVRVERVAIGPVRQ